MEGRVSDLGAVVEHVQLVKGGDGHGEGEGKGAVGGVGQQGAGGGRGVEVRLELVVGVGGGVREGVKGGQGERERVAGGVEVVNKGDGAVKRNSVIFKELHACHGLGKISFEVSDEFHVDNGWFDATRKRRVGDVFGRDVALALAVKDSDPSVKVKVLGGRERVGE